MIKQIIKTTKAPQAIGTYSQAIRVRTGGDTVYLSGQIGLDPDTMQMIDGIDAQIRQVFNNLQAVATASGGDLGDIVKLNIFLTDLIYYLFNFAKQMSFYLLIATKISNFVRHLQ